MRKQEQKWQAESDVRTLVEAAKIGKDPDRKRRAIAMQKAMLTELQNIKVS